MNKVILIGRLVKDPDIRTGTNNITIADTLLQSKDSIAKTMNGNRIS